MEFSISFDLVKRSIVNKFDDAQNDISNGKFHLANLNLIQAGTLIRLVIDAGRFDLVSGLDQRHSELVIAMVDATPNGKRR